jgi:hypothetical protein
MTLAHVITEDIDLHGIEARGALAKMVIKLFNLWRLSTADQLELLGLSPKSRTLLAKYARGDVLPESRDVLDRVGLLLSIHKSLRLLYPFNADIRHSWVNRRNTAFANLTPLAVMKEQGIIGFARVARYLDYYRGR